MRPEVFCTAVLTITFLIVLAAWWDAEGPPGWQMAGLATLALAFPAVLLAVVSRPSGGARKDSGGGWAGEVLRDLTAAAAVLDRNAAIVAANEAFLRGFAPQGLGGRITGLPVSDLVDPADGPALAAATAAIADGSRCPDASVILRILPADRADGPARMSLTPLRDPEEPGSDTTGFSLLLALPGPHSAPADSAAEDDDNRLLINRIEEIVFRIDAEGRLVFLNASWAALLDHAPDDSLGQPLTDFIHPEDRPLAGAQLTALARGQRGSCHIEARLTAQNGASCWMELRARPMSSPAGEWGGVAGTLTDISRMKRTEASLREHRRSLSMLLSNVPGMLYRCKNDRNWSFDFASDGCLDVTGYEPYEIVGGSGLSYIGIVHPDDRAAAWEFVRHQVALHRKFQLIYRIVTRSGQIRWVWEQGKGVISSAGEILALEGFITVIAEDGEDEIVDGFRKLLPGRGPP
ncbi:PAS domain-containing protein [Pseudogemmobacter humi]|uniref:histidine kinase n=1 Tax=Pseudogemmobacter humi TaxID=2483812 RepID=A0A3P5WRY8_9RHOB|nr:PAS domain-containing protein [Pseudogemmobacter humi]VDC24458.1 putative diguanylate cyclase [Pseudogemmobacter humi]